MTNSIFQNKKQEFLGTYDFFDTLGGVGYVTLYLGGEMVQTNVKGYFITLDSSISSDEDNWYTTGASDLNFDLEVGKPFRIKVGTAIINWTVRTTGAGTSQTTWNIYHVAVGGAETSIGSVIGDAYTRTSHDAVKKCAKISVTAKAFKNGEKLRINAVTTANPAVAGWHFDPAGRTTGTTTADSFLKLPVDLPI